MSDVVARPSRMVLLIHSDDLFSQLYLQVSCWN